MDKKKLEKLFLDIATPEEKKAFKNKRQIEIRKESIEEEIQKLKDKIVELSKQPSKGDQGNEGRAGKDGSPDTGEQIVDKINELEPEPKKQIDFLHIKNFPWNEIKKIGNNLISWGGGIWGSITGTLSDQTDLQSALDAKGDVSKVGTPANNQMAVWTGDGTIEGDPAFTFDTANDVLAFSTANDNSLFQFEVANGATTEYGSLIISPTDITFGIGPNGVIQFIADGATNGIFDFSNLSTSDKTFTFPNATGTIALQSAASGSFTTADGKTVSVTNGIITSIV